ncbi:MAG: tetratricopeptide repeat protein, partial [Actinomycetota bacterium]
MEHQSDIRIASTTKNCAKNSNQEVVEVFLPLQPESWQTHHQLGEVLQEQGRLENAIASYHHALELNPNSFWSCYNLAEAFMALEQWQEAVTTYRRAIALNPQFAWSYYSLGEALSQLEKW